MSFIERAGGFVGSWLANTAEAGQDFRDLADFADDGTQQIGESIEGVSNDIERSGQVARDKMIESKAASTGAKVGSWLSKPVNLIFTVLVIAGVLWGARS